MSKNQLNSPVVHNTSSLINIIENLKTNYDKKEVFQTIQTNFPALILLSTCKETEHNYNLPKGYMYDSLQKVMYYKNEPIKLTRKEILFLELLFKNSSRFVTYNEFSNYVWIDDVMTPFSIRALVKNLRKKLSYNFIENLSGVGYKLLTK